LEAPTFAMQAEWTMSELLGYIGTWSAVQRFRETTGHDPLPELARELKEFWGEAAQVRTVRWPLSLRVGVPSS
jgi:hypothetical protein